MDPITAFATIVGLIGLYKAEGTERDRRNFDKYLDWLRKQEHSQLVDLIIGNDQLARAIRVLIEDQHNEVMQKLGELDQILSGVARRFAEFQPLADAIKSRFGLSDQAVSVLRQLNEASVRGFIEIIHGSSYWFLDGDNRKLQIDEPRFIEDDLLTLCGLRLLRQSCGSKGERIFTITREGAAVGQR